MVGKEIEFRLEKNNHRTKNVHFETLKGKIIDVITRDKTTYYLVNSENGVKTVLPADVSKIL